MGFEYVLCYICGEIAEEEWKEIYIKDMYLYLHFHTNCWLESGGEEQEDFETEEEWVDFAGKEHKIFEEFYVSRCAGIKFYRKR